MHPVVDDVARDEQADLGDVQHRRVVGVGVPGVDRNQCGTLSIEAAFVDDAHVDLADG